MLARMEAVGSLEDDGTRSPTRCGPRPTRSRSEATRDHGRLAEHGLARLPTPVDRPLQILTHCNTGPLACGQFGTALGVVQAGHQAGRQVHVHVDETRPYLQGARLTAWELSRRGCRTRSSPTRQPGRCSPRVRSTPSWSERIGSPRTATRRTRSGRIRWPRWPPATVCRSTSAPRSARVDLETENGSAIPIEERTADRGPGVRRRPGRTARGDGLEPGLRRDPGRAHLGDRDRGGCAGCAIRPGAGRRGRGKAGTHGARRRGRRPRPDGHDRCPGRPRRRRRPDDHRSPRAAGLPRTRPAVRRLRDLRPGRPRVCADPLGCGI